MPRAIPLGRTRYAQFLLYPAGPGKPRYETEAWTQEFKKPYRYGVGSVVRLGRLGLHVGRWTTMSPEMMTSVASARGHLQSSDDDGVRLITEDEIEGVRDLIQDGWEPPLWHWRRWLDMALPTLSRLDLVRVTAYNEMHWHRPQWLVGNDGLTVIERYVMARQWRKGAGRIPSEEEMEGIRLRADQVTEGWQPVPAVPDCGPACAHVHTFLPPCQWAQETHEAAMRSAYERSKQTPGDAA